MDDKVYSNTLLKNGRLTIPAKVRKLLGLRPGDLVDFVEEGGHTFLRRIPKPDAATAQSI